MVGTDIYAVYSYQNHIVSRIFLSPSSVTYYSKIFKKARWEFILSMCCIFKVSGKFIFWLSFRLAEMGHHVGLRILDVLIVREVGFKREVKLLRALLFVKSNLWKVRG